MTESATAYTDVKGTTPMIRVFLTDEFAKTKEIEAGLLGNFIRWRVQDWLGISKFPTTSTYTPTGITVDMPEAASQDFYSGFYVVGKILSISDPHNMVVGVPTTKVSPREPQVYRPPEASTIGDNYEQSSSTILEKELTRHIEDTIHRLFESARELYFEDGMETDFSRGLVSLVKKYGNLAMGEISYLITCGRVAEEVASEALRWLARIDDASTYGWRLWVLEKSLSSKSPVVRDGAALGLVSMGDVHAIPHIRKAIDKETITELLYDLQGALKELEGCYERGGSE
jgi:hypothetical protein